VLATFTSAVTPAACTDAAADALSWNAIDIIIYYKDKDKAQVTELRYACGVQVVL
jgi:hypothetical protein